MCFILQKARFLMFEYLDTLNEEQRKAATHIEGPLLIIAGAGSGKTTTLVNRIAYMVDNGILPENILLMTFTNAAADNMKLRASKLSNPECGKVTASTYHSFCADILRKYGTKVGLSKDFVIITPNEELEAFKLCKSELGFGAMKNFPKAKDVCGVVSLCLNACENVYDKIDEIFESDDEVRVAVHKVVDKVFEYKKKNNLVSYDDLLTKMYELLQIEEVRSALESHYKYVMVDEYQDTCKIQEKIVMLLTKDNRNLVVVGDDYQCWHKDSLVETTDGPKKVSDICIGDEVQTIKKGKVCFSKVTNKTSHLGKVLSITTESGKNIRVTKEHKMFASSPDFNEKYYVYLMYRKDKGFRIGITSGGKTKKINARTISERPEKLWYLKRCETKAEACYWESYLSLEYQIPTLPFYCKDRNIVITQGNANKIFDKFGANGFKLLEDFCMLFDYPNFIPQGTTRCSEEKKNVNLQMDASHKYNSVSFEHNGQRIRKCFSNYKDAFVFAKKLVESQNATLVEKLFIKEREFLNVVTASSLTVSMRIPVIENGEVVLDKIMTIEEVNDFCDVYDLCEVYHIEVESTGILIADKVVSHNCIYSFRGADISNIIEFPKRVGGCENAVIDTNYRSTKEILDVANEIMKANADFGYPKVMKDAGSRGSKVRMVRPENIEREAEAVYEEIVRWQSSGKNLAEFAVLERNSNSSARLELLLTKNGIEFEKLGGLKFLEHQCVIDMLSFFKVISNQNDELSWFHLLDILPGIGEVYAHRVMGDLKTDSIENHPVWSKKGFYKDLLGLTVFIRGMSRNAGKMEFEKVFDLTVKYYFDIVKSKIDKMVCKDEETRILAMEQMENDKETIALLKEIAMKYNGIVEFLDSIVLDATPVVPSEGKVVISTIHSAKGMEWEHVSLLDAMDGIVPNMKNTRHDEDMEDLRCLYVALTRAKNEEVIYAPMEAMVLGCIYTEPSSFLKSSMGLGMIEMPREEKKRKQKIYLNVSYYDKEEAKSYGAKWDANERCWYCYDTDKYCELLIKMFGQVR